MRSAIGYLLPVEDWSRPSVSAFVRERVKTGFPYCPVNIEHPNAGTSANDNLNDQKQTSHHVIFTCSCIIRIRFIGIVLTMWLGCDHRQDLSTSSGLYRYDMWYWVLMIRWWWSAPHQMMILWCGAARISTGSGNIWQYTPRQVATLSGKESITSTLRLTLQYLVQNEGHRY